MSNFHVSLDLNSSVTFGSNVSISGNLFGNLTSVGANTNVTYTFLSTDSSKLIELTNVSAITATLPNNLAKGWNCSVVQGAGGTVTLTAASGATLINRQAQYNTAGTWAAVSVYVSTNVSGTNAAYVLVGDTA